MLSMFSRVSIFIFGRDEKKWDRKTLIFTIEQMFALAGKRNDGDREKKADEKFTENS